MNAPVMNDLTANQRHVSIELGRTQIDSITDKEFLPGTTIALNQSVDEPVHVLADNTLVARGEIVIVNNRFCVRVTDVIAHVDAIA